MFQNIHQGERAIGYPATCCWSTDLSSAQMHSMGVACVSHLAVGAAAVAMTIFMLSPSALSVAVVRADSIYLRFCVLLTAHMQKSIVGAAKTGNEYVHGWQERSGRQIPTRMLIVADVSHPVRA